MPGRTPSNLNIQLGAYTFIMNPNKMDVSTASARSLFTNLAGGTIVSDLVSGAAVVQKHVWKFSGIDDGDYAQVLVAARTPGATTFRDIYGDTWNVVVEAEVPLSVEGRRPSYGDFSFTLREV